MPAPTDTPATPVRAPARAALLAACALGLAAGWGMTAAGAGVGELADAYSVGLVVVGLFTTALALPYAALQLPAGLLIDRIGARAAGLLGLGVVLVAYLAASVAPVTELAFVARALAGAGSAACFVAGAELIRAGGVGPAGMGLFGGFAMASGGAAVVVVPALQPLLGWRSAWLTCAAVAALGLVTLLRRLPAGAPRRREAGAEPERRSVLRDGELHRLAAIHAVTLGLGFALSNWAAVVLEDTWGMTPRTAAATASVILLTAILSRPLGGYLVRRYPSRARATAVATLLTGGAATAALAVPTTPAVAVLAVVALGLMSGLPFAAVIAGAQARRPDRPAAAVGLLNAHANALIVVGTPLLGAAIEASLVTVALLAVAGVWLAPLLALPWRRSRP